MKNNKIQKNLDTVQFGSIYATGSPYPLCMANSMCVNIYVKINTTTFLHATIHTGDKMRRPGITCSTLGTTGFLKFTKIIRNVFIF